MGHFAGSPETAESLEEEACYLSIIPERQAKIAT
jgi:hypothetical protein